MRTVAYTVSAAGRGVALERRAMARATGAHSISIESECVPAFLLGRNFFWKTGNQLSAEWSNWRRPLLRVAVIGCGSVTAAGAVGGAVTLTAIWIIAGALGAAPHLNTRMPMAPATVGLAEAYGKFAAAAKDSGWMHGFTHTVRIAETALDARLASAEILTSSLVRTQQPAEAMLASADDSSPRDSAPPAPSRLLSTVRVAPQHDAVAPATTTHEAAAPAPVPEQRVATAEAPSIWSSIFSKVFGGRSASLEAPDSVVPPPQADGHTAIYDIAAHTVYLPRGERLEAHSGIGEHMDDPRYIRERARGPTPPNVYNLTLRESLFHGVRAIRLNPVNDDKMYGRDGILAHTFMLGPSGQSNGCVSFRDYQEFLNAYLRGEVNRMIVVPHLDTRVSSMSRG
jgi:hypothetical protein